MKNILHAKTKLIDISDGEELILLLNEKDGRDYGISPLDKVILSYQGKEIILNADLTTKFVKPWQVWLFKDVYQKYDIPENSPVYVSFTHTTPKAVDAIKNGLLGKKLSEKDYEIIMKEIGNNRFSDVLSTYFSALGFLHRASEQDLYRMTKSMAHSGEMLQREGIAADKHCIWGVPGNETTMIIIPLLASLGILMPKTFSKAITSPAATGECVSVLMDISFSKKEIQKLVEKENSCLVRGGGLDLAPADEKLIKVAYPLSMQSYSRTLVSILAKKYAMGITHSLIDIPVWPTAKVIDAQTAENLKRKFEHVGKKLWMKMHVEITDAVQPIGSGIGAVLQVREVLRVLQQHPARPMDLEEKALHLCTKIIEMVGMAKGKEAEKLAYGQLISWEAWKKMQRIIKNQHGNPDVYSETLPLGEHTKDILASKNGRVKHIDMKALNLLARALGAPLDLKAWVYLYHKLGAPVKKWAPLFTLYASDDSKIDLALKFLKEKKIYTIQ